MIYINIELGRKIKTMRADRGLTQEALAETLGVTAQAVSKWENGVSAPDIGMLPAISIAFGVTIDELFSLSEDENLKRIENMLCDKRDLSEQDFASTQSLLLGIISRKPNCGEAYLRLAELYEHRIKTFTRFATDYAKQAVRIMPENKAYHSVMTNVLHGYGGDWTCTNTLEMVRYYRELMQKLPDWQESWRWLLDQLIGNGLLDEARDVVENSPFKNNPLAKARLGDIAYAKGDGEEALRLWQECIDDNPDAWRPYAWRADKMVAMGRYNDAIRDYEAWLEKQPHPAYNDPYICMALIYEQKGDIPKAIEMREKQLRVMTDDFNFQNGEALDGVQREITRLKTLL